MGCSGEKLILASTENMEPIRPKDDTAFHSLSSEINAFYQVNSMITCSEATETDIGGLIDGVNALVVLFTKPFLCVGQVLQ